MAQARRTRRSGRQCRDGVLLEGSYSFERKITVEWETPLELDEFERLLAPFLTEPRSFAEIRTYASGALRKRDSRQPPPPGRISKYMVSTRSLRNSLAAMAAAGRVAQSDAPKSGAHLFSRGSR